MTLYAIVYRTLTKDHVAVIRAEGSVEALELFEKQAPADASVRSLAALPDDEKTLIVLT